MMFCSFDGRVFVFTQLAHDPLALTLFVGIRRGGGLETTKVNNPTAKIFWWFDQLEYGKQAHAVIIIIIMVIVQKVHKQNKLH